MKTKLTTCPACNSYSNLDQVITFSPIEATQNFLPFGNETTKNQLSNHISGLWQTDSVCIVKCNECGSRFADPHIAGDATFYNLVAPYPVYPKSRWEFELTLTRAFKLLEVGDQLLEIGAGSGKFIEKIIDLGISPDSITATEFSTDARISLRQLGIHVVEKDFRSGIEGAPFKVIILFQTLEHLDGLDYVLNALSGLATHDAHIFISVPNIEYIEWSEENLGGFDMPPNHITSFSLEGLSKLFVRNGWVISNTHLHTREKLIDRGKFAAMRGLQYPRTLLQKKLSKFVELDSDNKSKIKLILCAALVVMSDWSLLKRVPAEDILVEIERLQN